MKIKVATRVSQVEEYYFSRKLREIAKMRAAGIDVINLGIGSPDRVPSRTVVDRLCREARTETQHGYQSYIGVPELRQAFAQWMKVNFDTDVDPEGEVLPLIGSKEGIMHIAMTYLEAGDEVLVPDPGYPTYASASLLTGATVRKYGLTEPNGWKPNLADLEKQDLSKVKLMWVNYPHMPTGTRGSRDLFEDLVAFGVRNNILICHDNPYAFILNEEPMSMLSIPGAREVVLELHSLSKTYNMAGWRVGFLTGASERIQEVLRFKSNMDSGMFKPVQLAAAEALSLSSDWYRDVNAVYRSRRSLAEELLQFLGCTYNPDQVGMFLWARIPSIYEDGIAMADEILDKAHVFITPGNIFGGYGKEYIRLSLCSDSSILLEAIQRCKSRLVPKTSVTS